MTTTNNKQQMTNIKFIFEYNRDTDKQTPNKISKTKELMSLHAEYSFLNIGFSCGKHTDKDTICNFDTYIKDNTEATKLVNKLFVIWSNYIYIKDNKIIKVSK